MMCVKFSPLVTGPCALIESNYKFSTSDNIKSSRVAVHRLIGPVVETGEGAKNECIPNCKRGEVENTTPSHPKAK